MLDTPQLQIANPFPSNEDVFVRRIWCEKTTSSWQKVHPKQKNLPENKALLRGGSTLGGVGNLYTSTIRTAFLQRKNVLRRIENGPAPKKKDFDLLDDAWQVTCFGDGLVIQTEQLLLLLRSVRWLFSGSGVMEDRGPPNQKSTPGKLQAWKKKGWV